MNEYVTSEQIMQRLNEHLEQYKSVCSYDWFGIFLFGSQNYGLSDKNSDVDSRIIYFGPATERVREYTFENGEHIEAITLIDFYKGLTLSDFQSLETLYSQFYIINPKWLKFWNSLVQIRQKISRMSEQKWLQRCKELLCLNYERYQKGEQQDRELFERCGCAVKQVAQLVRLNECLDKYCGGCPYDQVLVSSKKTQILDIKRGKLPKVINDELSQLYFHTGLEKINNYTPKRNNIQTEYELQKIFFNFIKKE